MVARKAGKATKQSPHTAAPGTAGVAYTAGWWLFLAMVALTPIALGALPSRLGAIATIRAYDPFTLTKTVTILVLSGLSLAALCVAVLRREAEVYWHPVMWVVTGLVGWAGISTIFSKSHALSIWGSSGRNEGLVALLGYAIVAFLAIQYVRTARELRTLSVAAVASGLLVSAYALVQLAGLDPYTWVNEFDRIAATFGNADILGTYLVFPLGLALGLALSSGTRKGLVGWLAAAGLISAALWASATRGGWIGALVMVLAFAIAGWGAVWTPRKWHAWVLAGVGALLAAAAVAIVFIRPNLGRSATSLQSLLQELSNGRTVIWLTGLRAWMQHPITGWGPDGFIRAFPSAVGPSWYAMVSGYVSADTAHNFLIQTLVSLGLPGLVLMLWVLGQTMWASLRQIRGIQGRPRVLVASVWGVLFGLVVALFFGVTLPGVSIWLWLTVGLLLAPLAQTTTPLPKAVSIAGASVGVVLAIWAGTWMVADFAVGRAMQLPTGQDKVAGLMWAAQLNPLAPAYKGLAADALLNLAVAQQQAGESRATVDATLIAAINTYGDMAVADPGDPIVRAAMANILIGYARNHPGTDAANRAVQYMQEAAQLAPHDAAVLVTLARAYQAAGRPQEAAAAAQLARQVAPDYASQALSPLGL